MKKLLALNIFLFILLAACYVFTFELQSGIGYLAITWGLPVAIIIIIDIFLFSRFKKAHVGKVIILFTILGIIYCIVLTRTQDYTLFAKTSPSTNRQITVEEQILDRLLDNTIHDGSYMVLIPKTRGVGFPSDMFANSVPNWEKLADRYRELNAQSVILDLNSIPESHKYVVDYENRFDRDLDLYSWTGWYFFHPHAAGCLEVTLPAYDPVTGYVLIYEGWVNGGLTGYGQYILLNYRDGQFEYISSYPCWVS
jgi:hypothetical protein